MAEASSEYLRRERTGDEPRPFRLAINQNTLLVRADGAQSAAIITNISQSGFRVQVTGTVEVGEHVFLRGRAGDVPAQIRWVIGHDAGGVFLQPKDCER